MASVVVEELMQGWTDVFRQLRCHKQPRHSYNIICHIVHYHCIH